MQENLAWIADLKPAYCQMLANAAREMPQTPNLEQIEQFTPILPHLEDAAHNLLAGYREQDLIWAFLGIAWFYARQGLYQQAEPWYEKCVEVTTQRMGTDHPDVALSLNNLAALYDNQGRYDAAEPLYLRSLKIREAKLGTDHPDVAQSLNNLAVLYDNQGRYDAAEPLYKRAISISEQKRGADHPTTVLYRKNLQQLQQEISQPPSP